MTPKIGTRVALWEVTPEEWAGRSPLHAQQLAEARAKPLPPGVGTLDRGGDWKAWGLAPDGWPAKGPPEAPYGWDKNGNALPWRPGRRPGARNRETRMIAQVAAEMAGLVPVAPPVAPAPAKPPSALAPFVADEAELQRVCDDAEERNRVRLIEYARSWQVVRAALKSGELTLRERAALAMDVIKAAHASKDVFVVNVDASDLGEDPTVALERVQRQAQRLLTAGAATVAAGMKRGGGGVSDGDN